MADEKDPKVSPAQGQTARNTDQSRGSGTAAKRSKEAATNAEEFVKDNPKGVLGGPPATTPVAPAGRDDIAYAGSAQRDDEVDDRAAHGGKVLNSGTHVRNPDTGETEFLAAGTEAPSWATEKRKVYDGDGNERDEALVGEHLLGEPADLQREPSVDLPVPVDRENEVPDKGAGRARWATFASAHGVICHAGATREDIMDALERAGIEL